jgi:uncharacterized protein (TIGR03435 family)
MNPIQVLSSQPWVERLGWTLVHFLWQGALIAALYAGARKAVKRISSPNARYLLACAAFAGMMVAPLVTWCLILPSHAIVDPAYRVRDLPPAASSVSATALSLSIRAAGSSVAPAQLLPWVVAIWLIGAIAFWVRLAGGWVVASRMRSMLVRAAPPEWQQLLTRLGSRVGVSRPVRLLVSALVQVPTVVGWLRPVVLVPVGALSGLPPEHLEALFVHELAHIRRHDYLVNILQSVAEALLFYHPAIWWVSGHLRAERESCCDDVAVSVTGDVLTYVQALAEWESCRPAPFNPAVAVNGGSLAHRVARLLGQSRPPARTGPGPGVLALAMLLVVAAIAVFGQPAARPEFQVASIKPNTAVGARGMGVRALPGGRLTAMNAPLMMLIQNAYTVQASQVVGGPNWINSEGYDIEAKPEGNTDRPHMWLMLQSLLADRFKLALHRETREYPVYALTVTKGGLKPPPPNAGSCLAIDTNTNTPPTHGAPPGFPCGRVGIMGSPSGLLQMQGGKVFMSELVRILGMVMGRPVVDKTGLAGEFDVHLEFTPDESTMGLPGSGGKDDPGGPPLATDPGRPNIFAALQEQLGLKLTSAKGPVEVLVIDHVERPTAN